MSSSYVHGTSEEEQRRLSRLNDLLNATSLQQMAPRRGDRVLDVGCGLGQFSRAMARAVGPDGRVVGIERSAEQIAEARRQAEEAGEASLVDIRRGDVQGIELQQGEWGSFDIAHARFILEHVPRPLDVVHAMLRAVRPGGRVVLEDDDHALLTVHPEIPGLDAVWRAYMQTYSLAGNDPLIGRRLVSLIVQAGGAPRRNTLLFFGSCAGGPDFDLYVENLAGVLEGAREAIVETGTVGANDFVVALANLRAWGQLPDAAFWFARCWAEGVRTD